MKRSDKKIITIVLAIVLLLIIVPLFALKGAEFGGSDDAGSQEIEAIAGEYEPWFTPVLEQLIGGELPGEVESLIFCVQTGIGPGGSYFHYEFRPPSKVHSIQVSMP